MIRYVFRDDQPLAIKGAKDADPQVIGEALAAISDKLGGHLTPVAVVDAARDKKHVLHRHFEWDDALAADAYRLDQARHIVRVVRVEDEDAEGGTARAYLSISEKNGVSYRPIEAVKKSVDLQAAVLKGAERDLRAFEMRYKDLIDICDLVRTARERITSRRNKHESRAAA